MLDASSATCSSWSGKVYECRSVMARDRTPLSNSAWSPDLAPSTSGYGQLNVPLHNVKSSECNTHQAVEALE
jgi:hypothetical protein